MSSSTSHRPRIGLLYYHGMKEFTGDGYCSDIHKYFLKLAAAGKISLSALDTPQRKDHLFEKGPDLKAVRAGRFAGLVTIGIEDNTYFQKLLELKKPIVALDFQPPDSLPIDAVTFDGLQGGYQAGKVLVERGHRDIVFFSNFNVTMDPDGGEPRILENDTSLDRRTGVQRAVMETDAEMWPVIPHYFQPGVHSPDAFRKRWDEIVHSCGRLPTAAVSHNDTPLSWARDILAEQGKKTPENLSMITFHGSIELAKMAPPPMNYSHILYSWLDMGKSGWGFLKDRLDGKVKADAPQRFEPLPGKYMERGTVTDAPKTEKGKG